MSSLQRRSVDGFGRGEGPQLLFGIGSHNDARLGGKLRSESRLLYEASLFAEKPFDIGLLGVARRAGELLGAGGVASSFEKTPFDIGASFFKFARAASNS